jgi:glyoxylase-like metal-dependent hydrolase (beta-lactamase superfamily II)
MEPSVQVDELLIAEVAPGVHRIVSPLGTRRMAQWLVAGTERLLLVDAGVATTPDDVLVPALARLGRTSADITDVVITHADVDHYGGIARLRTLAPRALIRAHAADRPLIERFATIARVRYGWYRAHHLDYPEQTWAWLQDAAGPDTALDGDLEPGEHLDLGGDRVLEVLHLPGHSDGHVGLWDPRSRTAIVADAAMGDGFFDRAGRRVAPAPYGDVDAYRATIARLRALDVDHLETSHFRSLDAAGAAAHLATTERFVAAAAALVDHASDDLPLADLLARADAQLGPYPEATVELARCLGAHRAQRAQRAGGR